MGILCDPVVLVANGGVDSAKCNEASIVLQHGSCTESLQEHKQRVHEFLGQIDSECSDWVKAHVAL